MTSLFNSVSFAIFTMQSATYDYAYIGPGKNDVPWPQLIGLAACAVAVIFVLHGVINDRRR